MIEVSVTNAREYLHEQLGLLSSPPWISKSFSLLGLGTYDPRAIVVTASSVNKTEGQSIKAAGVGIYYEEALSKLIGEVLERHALMTYSAESIIRDSYNTLKGKNQGIIDARLLQLYSGAKDSDIITKFDPDRPVGWVRCQSLISPGEERLIPAQLVLGSYKTGGMERRFWYPVSTGTAAHTTFNQALVNAILEYFEADAFMTCWYTARRAPSIDYRGTIMETVVEDTMSPVDNSVRVFFLYLSLPHTPVHVVLAFITRSKGFPNFSLGLGSSLDPVRATYHAFLEAIGLYISSKAYLWNYVNEYIGPVDFTKIYNLRSNYLFYLKPDNRNLIVGLLRNLVDDDGRVKLEDLANLSKRDSTLDLDYLIERLAKVSRYAVMLDITSPIARQLGFRVARICVPELLHILPPSLPYDNHPMIIRYGGIRNVYPHPLP